ncbi:Amino acid permease-associated protein [Candidatus Methylobacter favarea]|uniref:Amino acid permease-associated protein n=1 Tax=Candidatus Methylobacter favarea TaxID=2707345 RepID=A0A8S0W8G8_9GAMM|nr:amino acid permease [Candidatus Methylobacter favarea]CAA9889274.1 Amino acid permease-associated protein [Candidatus Methylobacter favarea]
MATDKASLKRHITLWPLVLYGVGDILGAGIYGLVGKAAGQMGNAVWMAFIVSMIAASFTGLSYASLGSRYPRAGGASYVTHKAFRSNFLAYAVGLAVLASGLTSMATACRVFAGYFSGLFPLFSVPVIIIGFALSLTIIIFIGIRETIWANSFLAAIEICGLLFIILMGSSFVGSINYLDATTVQNPAGDLAIPLLLSGAVLTFYSFVGFEDILNVSEEIVEPRRTLPKGLLLSVAVASLIYMSISIVAVSVIPAAELALSKQPLVDVIGKAAPWFPPEAFSLIALMAVSNTALLNYVMGSRLLYGMSSQGLMPKFLAVVHPKRLTPHRAILILLVVLLILALSGDISDLARATSVLLLVCFSLMNLALILLQRKDQVKGRFEVPAFIPAAGLVVCMAMLTQANSKELLIAGGILVFIGLLYFFVKPSAEAIEKMDV